MCGVERLSQLCAIELTKAALESIMRDTEGDLFQQRQRMSYRNHGRFRMGNKISNGWWRVQDARASVGTKGLKAFQTSFDRNAEWRSGGVQVGAIADLSWGMGPRRRRSERTRGLELQLLGCLVTVCQCLGGQLRGSSSHL